jgi:hypothetical protein
MSILYILESLWSLLVILAGGAVVLLILGVFCNDTQVGRNVSEWIIRKLTDI